MYWLDYSFYVSQGISQLSNSWHSKFYDWSWNPLPGWSQASSPSHKVGDCKVQSFSIFLPHAAIRCWQVFKHFSKGTVIRFHINKNQQIWKHPSSSLYSIVVQKVLCVRDEKWWWQSANYLKLLRLVNIKLIRPEPPWVMLHHNLHNFPNTENFNLEYYF